MQKYPDRPDVPMRERSPYFGNSIGIYPCDECRQSDLSFPVIDSKVGHPNESCGSPPQDHWSRRCGVVRPERGPTSGQKPSSRQLCLSWLGIAVFSRTDFSFRPLATIERKWRTQAGMRQWTNPLSREGAAGYSSLRFRL